MYVSLLKLLDQVSVNFVQAERTTRLEHTVRYLWHVGVVIRHQVKPKDVLTRVKIDIVVAEDKVVAIVQLLTACDIDVAQVEAGRDKLAQTLSSDVSAAYINILQIRELLGEGNDTVVF